MTRLHHRHHSHRYLLKKQRENDPFCQELQELKAERMRPRKQEPRLELQRRERDQTLRQEREGGEQSVVRDSLPPQRSKLALLDSIG